MPLNFKKYTLIFFGLCLTFHFAMGVEAFGQAINGITINLDMKNDDSPLTNLVDYKYRHIDDHGLTFLFNPSVELDFKLLKGSETVVKYNFFAGLYARDLGITTALLPGDPSYGFYHYLLDKHPDWHNILVYDELSVSKYVHQIDLLEKFQRWDVGLSIKATSIDAGANQTMEGVQKWYHRLINTKAYYALPSYVDSNLYKGKNFAYYSISPYMAYHMPCLTNSHLSLLGEVAMGCWLNSSTLYGTSALSPFVKLQTELNFGKLLNEGTVARQQRRRFQAVWSCYYEPNELLPQYSDPGTKGYDYFGFNVEYYARKMGNASSPKKWVVVYNITPYGLFLPMLPGKDPIINYVPPHGDLRFIQDFLGVKVKLVLL